MRRWLLLLGGASLVVSSAVPAAATVGVGPQIGFTMTPVAGPPGTTVTVRGECQRSGTGGIGQSRNSYGSDARLGFTGHPFTTDSRGRFSTTLRLEGGPTTEALVGVTCQTNTPDGPYVTEVQPFVITDGETVGDARLFTAFGQQPCGSVSLVGSPFPCDAHVKGFSPQGAISTVTNFFASELRWGAALAAGDVDGSSTTELAIGSGPHQQAVARVVDVAGQPIFNQPVFGSFDGGVNVALGDVDGDGLDELIVGAGPGGGPHVRVFRMSDKTEIASFYAYDPAFTGGVYVAAADVNHNGRDVIVTGTGVGGGPHVRMFHGDGSPAGNSFFAYDPQFRGGVTVAAADMDLNGDDEIITGAGPGGGPHVRVFWASGAPRGGFFAYDASYRGGIYVAAGDVDRSRDATGSYSNEIVTGTVDGGPHVRTFTETGIELGSFHAYPPFDSGVRVAVIHKKPNPSGGTPSSHGDP